MRTLPCCRCHRDVYVIRNGQLTCNYCFRIPVNNSYACAIVDNNKYLQCTLSCSSSLFRTRYKSLGYCPRCNGFANIHSLKDEFKEFVRAHAIRPKGVSKKEKKTVRFGKAYRVKIGEAMQFETSVENVKE